MDFNACAFSDDEVELLGAGEVADARVGDVGRLVSRHHVVPHAHLRRPRKEKAEKVGSETKARKGF